MARSRCALAALPAEGGDVDRLLASLSVAEQRGLGDLGAVTALPSSATASARQVLATATEAATGAGCEWLLAVSAAETLSPDIFVKTAPALRLYGAIWGGVGVISSTDPDPKVERISRLAAQDLSTFFHAALQWWMGPSHFVRTAAARQALQALVNEEAWRAEYMLHFWKRHSAYKTAQRLTLSHAPLPPLATADRARLIEELEREPVFMSVACGSGSVRLPYTGLNPVIEREQMRGLFFEQEELRFLAERLPHGLRIVDVGANTGNHTVYFAMAMQAQTVVPIEPHPRAVAAIRAAVAENRLANVDLSCLGSAVGAARGMLRLIPSETAGLGATRFEPDPIGTIPVLPLDELASGPVDFLKIDAEGMELEVLAGAASLIARDRPFLYIEVVDEQTVSFLSWADQNGYRIEKLFPDKRHCNYFLAAAGRT
jgi:FkbM family methyltransferase